MPSPRTRSLGAAPRGRALLAGLTLGLLLGGGSCDADESCAEDEIFYTVGCGDPDLGMYAEIDEGCYIPCEDDPCPDGLRCTDVWGDPCWNSACRACGSGMKVCTPDR